MALKMNKIYGMSDEDIKELKARAKEELPFRVSIRVHRQKYAYGQIDIAPVKRNGKWRFSPKEIDAVIDFMDRYGLVTAGTFYHENRHMVYVSGINYVACKTDKVDFSEPEEVTITHIVAGREKATSYDRAIEICWEMGYDFDSIQTVVEHEDATNLIVSWWAY